MYYGQVVIIADRPKAFIGVLRKQWLRLARKMQVERARTLDADKITELGGTARDMLELCFTINYPPDEHPADVYIVSADQALGWPPECRTMYITGSVERHQQYLLTTWMPKGSLVVIYDEP